MLLWASGGFASLRSLFDPADADWPWYAKAMTRRSGSLSQTRTPTPHTHTHTLSLSPSIALRHLSVCPSLLGVLLLRLAGR